MSVSIQVQNLSVGRGRQAVLSDLNFSVGKGGRWALLGANGSGKTSLLRVLAGLDTPRLGQVKWLGGALEKGAARAKTVGILFQNEVSSSFTVRELLTLSLALDGPPNARARALVEQVLVQTHLTQFADRMCRELSGGEAQRVALARIQINDPKILLLDEPSNHLDPARQAGLFTWLEKLQTHTTVIIATHDLNLAATCNQIALLFDGKIELGPPEKILRPELIEKVFGIKTRRMSSPDGGPPILQIMGELNSTVYI